ncbi:hypothetical protein M404DRAFT_167813, partial [Pisolithus tinctorius Marx 270]
EQDTINPHTRADIMLLSHETDDCCHPYWYACCHTPKVLWTWLQLTLPNSLTSCA